MLLYLQLFISHFFLAFKDNESFMSGALWRLSTKRVGVGGEALWPAGGLHSQRDEKQLSAIRPSGTDGTF